MLELTVEQFSDIVFNSCFGAITVCTLVVGVIVLFYHFGKAINAYVKAIRKRELEENSNKIIDEMLDFFSDKTYLSKEQLRKEFNKKRGK